MPVLRWTSCCIAGDWGGLLAINFRPAAAAQVLRHTTAAMAASTTVMTSTVRIVYSG